MRRRLELAQGVDCRTGVRACVDAVIGEMTRRWLGLDVRCDHDAPFALLYLRTTEEFRRALDYLSWRDEAAVIREDVAFAEVYFQAFDSYHGGVGLDGGADHPGAALSTVPAAWRVAFDAAGARTQTCAGDALLGMNAHVQRDLPVVLAAVAAAGHPVSYVDHQQVDAFLRRVDVGQELATRYDPAFAETGGSAAQAIELLISWRQTAFQNYERLRDAPTLAARAQVATEVETMAAATAGELRSHTLGRYRPGGSACPS